MAPGEEPSTRFGRRGRRGSPPLRRWPLFGLVTAFGAACLALRYAAPEGSSLRYAVYVLLGVPLALPAALLLAQWAARASDRVRATLQVRRARRVFSQALRAARRHPELCDLDRVREAAAVLARHLGPRGQRRFPEVEEAAQHPYAPLRNAASRVLQAAASCNPAADNQKTPS